MSETTKAHLAISNVLDLWPGLGTMIEMAADDTETIHSRRRAAAEGAKTAAIIAGELTALHQEFNHYDGDDVR